MAGLRRRLWALSKFCNLDPFPWDGGKFGETTALLKTLANQKALNQWAGDRGMYIGDRSLWFFLSSESEKKKHTSR